MNFVLRANSTPDEAASWLRQFVRDFGLGFHLDTPLEDYRLPSGDDVFTSSECALLTASLERIFLILGDEAPYEICAHQGSAMLADRLGLKPPLEFNDSDVQHQLLESGTVDELSAWLSWNDSNRICDDHGPNIEERGLQSIEALRELMFRQISR